MIYSNVLLTVREESDVASVSELLAEQGRLSRGEAGCLRFEVYQSQTDSRFFILIERWKDQQALDEHRRGRAYCEIYQPRVLPLVDRVPHPSHLID
jgi:quinol monooxygenase YgiN